MSRFKAGLQEIDWGVVGGELARSDDQAQGDFMNAFCKELIRSCGTYHRAEMQLAYANAKITKENRDLLGMLSFEDKKTL